MNKSTSGLAQYGRPATHTGFTIIELLIVIVVIAVLATISVVAYTGIQNRANDSAVQNDLRQLGQIVSMYYAERGVYPTTVAQLRTYGSVSVSRSSYADYFVGTSAPNYLYCYNNTTNQFGLVARSRSHEYFQYRDGAVSPYTGSVGIGVASMCPNIGVTYHGRIWLRDSSGSWQI